MMARPATFGNSTTRQKRVYEEQKKKNKPKRESTNGTDAQSGKSIKESKAKGNAAFKTNQWDSAIKHYTRALRVDDRDHICLSNRSAALLKKGDPEAALEDAEKCIRLKPYYAKGYIRKAGALHAMAKFTAAVKTYQHGLLQCPGDKTLRQGLEQAKRARAANSRASFAARKTEATMHAAKSTKQKAEKSSTVTQFVKQTKKNIELQMAALQSQLDMVNELEKMKLDEKLELLYSLLDKDKDGHVDARELSIGLRKRNISMTFSDALERAVDLVAMYDEDGDAELDRDEFASFVKGMVKELKAKPDEFCEFLVYQILFTDEGEHDIDDIDKDELKHEIKGRGQLLGALQDPRMEALFHMFDKNGDGKVSFKEVACGLYQLTQDMEESAKATAGLLLMMEKDDKRDLIFDQFAKLILSIVASSGTSFDEVANDLTVAMSRPGSDKLDKQAMKALTIAEKDYKRSRERQRAEQAQHKIMDALSYGRTTRLFDQWDQNGDGHIQFDELFAGLQRYQTAAAKEQDVYIDAEKVAIQLMALDSDGDHQLDKEEFATAMVTYADAMKADLHQLIDFMCVVTALGDFL